MMNPIDKFIEIISPRTALQRTAARQALRIVNSGYSEGGASSRKTSMKGWNWRGGDTKLDIEMNLPTLRQRSRDLYMNTGVARAALNRMQSNVVGNGLQLRPQPDADFLGITREEATAWTRTVQREWALWAESKDCDALGLNTFAELQQIAVLAWLQSGDVFATLPLTPLPWQPYDLRIRLIEADRVSTPTGRGLTDPNLHDGVEVDSTGRVVAYHMTNAHPLGIGGCKAEWVRIPARGDQTGRYNVLHLMVAERPDQYRGIPVLAPVIEACKQLGRYQEAELTGAVVAALYTVFIKSNTPDSPLGEAFAPSDTPNTDPEADYEYNLAPGAVVGLAPNEDISIANPGRPNAQFDAFVNAVSTEIGAALNVPAELLLLRFTSSYSASRAALLEAWKGFRMWRAWMADDFCQPVYTEWLTEAILRGRIKAPGFSDPAVARAWAKSEWHGPSPGQIDPGREVAASIEKVKFGLSTYTKEAAEINGTDYADNIARQSEEKQIRIDNRISDPNYTPPPQPAGGTP